MATTLAQRITNIEQSNGYLFHTVVVEERNNPPKETGYIIVTIKYWVKQGNNAAENYTRYIVKDYQKDTEDTYIDTQQVAKNIQRTRKW